MKQDNAQLTATDLAWLAGFIDGEGTLSIYEAKSPYPHVRAYLSVGNTHQKTMRRVQRIVSTMIGREARLRSVTDNRGHRPLSRLDVHALRDLLPICIALSPYLVTKQAQVRLMMKFIELGPGRGGKRKGPGTYRMDQTKRMALMLKCRALNVRYSASEWIALKRETKRSAP